MTIDSISAERLMGSKGNALALSVKCQPSANVETARSTEIMLVDLSANVVYGISVKYRERVFVANMVHA